MDDVGHPQATGDGGNPVIRALLDLMSDRGRAEQHVGSYALGRVVHFTGGLDQSIIKTLVKVSWLPGAPSVSVINNDRVHEYHSPSTHPQMLYSPTFLARGSLIATFARMESLGQSGALNTPPGTLAPRSRPGSPRRTFGESSAPQPAGLGEQCNETLMSATGDVTRSLPCTAAVLPTLRLLPTPGLQS